MNSTLNIFLYKLCFVCYTTMSRIYSFQAVMLLWWNLPHSLGNPGSVFAGPSSTFLEIFFFSYPSFSLQLLTSLNEIFTFGGVLFYILKQMAFKENTPLSITGINQHVCIYLYFVYIYCILIPKGSITNL